jgi:hypothetical protein
MPEPPRPSAPSAPSAPSPDEATTTAAAASAVAETRAPARDGDNHAQATSTPATTPAAPPTWRDGITPIGDVRWRDRVTIAGRVQTLRVKSSAGGTSLEAVIEDDTGAMSIVFIGRKHIGGFEVGTKLRAQGMAAEHRGRLAILNPAYALIADRH